MPRTEAIQVKRVVILRINAPTRMLLTRVSILLNIQMRMTDMITTHIINKVFKPSLTNSVCRSLAAESARINASVMPANRILTTDFIVHILGKKVR